MSDLIREKRRRDAKRRKLERETDRMVNIHRHQIDEVDAVLKTKRRKKSKTSRHPHQLEVPTHISDELAPQPVDFKTREEGDAASATKRRKSRISRDIHPLMFRLNVFWRWQVHSR